MKVPFDILFLACGRRPVIAPFSPKGLKALKDFEWVSGTSCPRLNEAAYLSPDEENDMDGYQLADMLSSLLGDGLSVAHDGHKWGCLFVPNELTEKSSGRKLMLQDAKLGVKAIDAVKCPPIVKNKKTKKNKEEEITAMCKLVDEVWVPV